MKRTRQGRGQTRRRPRLRRSHHRLNRRRPLLFETLEQRQVLSSAPLVDLSQLSVDTTQYDTSRLLVRFQDEASMESSVGIVEGAHLGQAYSLVDGLYEIDLEAGVSLQDALAAFQNNPAVLYAQPDYHVQLTYTPNDPSFDQLWGLNNTGQSGGTFDADIDGPEAWDAFAPPATDPVIVAVIDTGVDYTHPDLINRMWVNPGEIAGNGVDDDNNGFVDDVYGADFVNNDGDPMDDYFHGTHVAGTIAAEFDNGIGVTGVVGNANVEIMALKFLDDSGGGYTSDAIRALQYAVANGAQISNNSWGGGGFSQALFDAISDAANAGHIFVAAAGNDGSNNDSSPSYPASYELGNIVAVAATDRNDQLASFSNYGTTSVDLGAPGVDILSTFPTYMTSAMQSYGFSTDYEVISGTSMATPHVSGVVALIAAQHPDWTISQITSKLFESVDVIPSLAGVTATGGRLNAASALGPDVSGPRVIQSTPSGAVGGSVGSVQLTFSEAIDPETFTIADDVVSFTGPNGIDLIDQIYDLSGSGTTYTITFASPLAEKGDYNLVIGPNIFDLAETPNQMDQDGDGNQGETPDDQYVGSFTIADKFTFVSDDVPAPILDGNILVSYLDINQDVAIGDLNVHLDISHTWDSDIEVYLVAPGGDPYSNPYDLKTLILHRGDDGNNFTGTVLDDQASTPIGAGAAPFTGSFQPEEPLSQFNGMSTLGQWQLWIYDAYYGEQGTLNSWSLEVLPEDAGPPPTNQAPIAEAGGPYAGNVNDTIVLDGSGSSDTDGTIVQYDWDLDNDGQYDVSGQTADYIATAAGSYTVGLRITDDDGATDTDTATVTVTDPGPSLGPFLQQGVVTSSSDWQTVTLDPSHAYQSMVVVTTPNYGNGQGPGVVRVRNAEGNSFDFLVVTPDGGAISGVDVYYMVVEEGQYNEVDDGIKMEAVKLTSSTTAHKGSWGAERQDYINSYTNPVVFGQVMTANDPNWSVFWSHGPSRTDPASLSDLYVGKHVGEDNSLPSASEEIGYIVFEAGSGVIGDLSYEVGLGGDSVQGVANSPPYSYGYNLAAPTTAILTQAAMDGGDGSWAILYGADPIGSGNLRLAVDEDQIGDSERSHTTEQVSFIVFQDNGAPNELPTAVITGGPFAGDEGDTFQFDGIDSFDPDGTIVSYQWKFGDGGTAVGAQPNYTYEDNGSYVVTLAVTDDRGATDSATETVTVSNVKPLVDAGSDKSANEGESVSFAGSFTDPGNDSHTIEWDFGDGSTANGLNPSHVFASQGIYTVQLTVTDDDGGQGTDSLVVTVGDSDPTAGFTFSPSSPVLGQDVAFTDTTVSYDGVTGWAWDFDGNGTTDSTQQNPTHAFAASGSYTVTVTVTEDDGDTDSFQDTVVVSEVPAVSPHLVYGQAVSANQEWTTVSLGTYTSHVYDNMVVVATPQYASKSEFDYSSVVVRIRNVTDTSFDFQVTWTNASTYVPDVPVYFVAVEAGVYNQAEHGITMEAGTFLSTTTDHKNSWVGQEVSYQQNYTSPVVLGQVMTSNDSAWSTFWTRGATKSSPPTASTLRIGKMVAEDYDTTREDETLGYIVFENGQSGSLDGVDFEVGLGSDSVRGYGNTSSGYAYSHGLSNATAAVLTQAGMDGNDGGWSVLFGSDPITSDTIHMVVDEDNINDVERNHTTEQIAYLVLGGSVNSSNFNSMVTSEQLDGTGAALPAANVSAVWSEDFVAASRNHLETIASGEPRNQVIRVVTDELEEAWFRALSQVMFELESGYRPFDGFLSGNGQHDLRPDALDCVFENGDANSIVDSLFNLDRQPT